MCISYDAINTYKENMNQIDIKIIFNQENSLSVEAGRRCQNSFSDHGFDANMVNGVWRDDYLKFLEESGVNFQNFDQRYSKYDAVVACFASHFNIWRIIDRPTLILEHDAVLDDLNSLNIFLENYNQILSDYPIIVNLGKPSFGIYKSMDKMGLYPSFSKGGRYIGGAHAYLVSPSAAQIMVRRAREFGALPVDLFLDVNVFPFIFEFWPWPIICKDSFSSIQLTEGSVAKHSYGDGFKLV